MMSDSAPLQRLVSASNLVIKKIDDLFYIIEASGDEDLFSEHTNKAMEALLDAQKELASIIVTLH